MGQLFETVKIDQHILQPTHILVGNQMKRCARPQRLAQFQEAAAQAVTGFRLAVPEQPREPLTIDGMALLRRQKSEHGKRLLRQFFKPTPVTRDHQWSKNTRACRQLLQLYT